MSQNAAQNGSFKVHADRGNVVLDDYEDGRIVTHTLLTPANARSLAVHLARAAGVADAAMPAFESAPATAAVASVQPTAPRRIRSFPLKWALFVGSALAILSGSRR